MPYTIRHTIETDVAGFWRLYFDEEYNRNLFDAEMQFVGMRVVEARTDADGVFHRSVEYSPRLELPAIVRSLIGDGVFTEVGRYEPRAGRYLAEWLPQRGASKLKTQLELRAEALHGKRCTRVMTIANSVRIPVLGPTIERLNEQNQRALLERAADFMNAWIKDTSL